jgi:hypothetical protein
LFYIFVGAKVIFFSQKKLYRSTKKTKIANHTEKQLPHRHQTLLAQLAVGYELLNYYRHGYDREAVPRERTIINPLSDVLQDEVHNLILSLAVG